MPNRPMVARGLGNGGRPWHHGRMLTIGRLALSIFITTALATHAASAASERPNVLLIMADDLGYGDLGCFGSKQIDTPNLDALAADGVRATDGYVCASICSPSRAGLLTGRYPQNFGFEHNIGGVNNNATPNARNGIPAGERTLGDFMKSAGYRTGIIGKWHVGHAIPEMLPNARGFDTFFGILDGHCDYFPKSTDRFLLRNGQPVEAVREGYTTDWFTNEAIEFINGNGPGAETHDGSDIDASDPWFLFLSYTAPHTPLQAKPEDLERFSHIPDAGRRTYAAMIWNMDQNIGRVVDTLREQGELDNTLIVFLSDNGGAVDANNACNAPLRGSKGTFLEGGVRVPFIFHWPAGGLKGGTTFERPFISLDLTPTFIKAAGGELPERPQATRGRFADKPLLDGVDLLPFLRGEAQGDPHEAIYLRMALRQQVVRRGDWKLQTGVHALPELFNVRDDPSELDDKILEHREMAESMQTLLNDWQHALEDAPHWLEPPYWQMVSFQRYQRPYQLVQPERDEAYSGRVADVRSDD